MTVAELHPVFVSEPGRNGQGLIFDCPHCLKQRFVIYFANPLDGGLPMPPQVGPKNFRWQRSGDTKEDVSLTPSVNCVIEHDALPAAEGTPAVAAFTEQHWHGFFTSRSRNHVCTQPPPRIRTSGIPASGSCLR